MISYHFNEWLLFFYIYSVLGWVFETTYVSVKKRKFVNRGFLKGPVVPIYGSGALMMLIVTLPVKGNIVLEFLFGMLGATLLEYMVGAVMESIYKVKYWDYSNQKFNLNGYICLSSSLAWGGLTIFMDEYLHKVIEHFVLGLAPKVLFHTVGLISVIFVTDVVISSKDAWNLRMILSALSKARQEIAELQQQLELKKEGLQLQLSQKGSGLVQKGSELLHSVNFRQKIAVTLDKEAILEKLDSAMSNLKSLENHLSFRNISILKRNPDATSKKFKESLDSIKDHLKREKK